MIFKKRDSEELNFQNEDITESEALLPEDISDEEIPDDEDTSPEETEDEEVSEDVEDTDDAYEEEDSEPPTKKQKAKKAKPQKQKKDSFINFRVFFRTLFLTFLAAFIVLALWVFAVPAVEALVNHKEYEGPFILRYQKYLGVKTQKIADVVEDVVEEASPVMLKDKTILVIGSDAGKINADVMLLVRLDCDSKGVDVISLQRDTLIKLNGRNHKLNAALHLAPDGKHEEFLVEQVEDIFGVKIDNYVFMSYEGFRDIVDAIDGVDFYVPQNMYYTDPAQDLYINLKEGQQHLDGAKAEQLVRFRQYLLGDIQRTKVQRDFIAAIFKQKLNSSIVDDIPSVVTSAIKAVDTDIKLNDAIQYATFVSSFDMDALNTYAMPGEPKDINGASYFIADTEQIDSLLADIEANRTPDNKNKNFNSEYLDEDVDENGLTEESDGN